MRQVEVSRTIVFDVPRRARAFFEALIADNIGVGRPEEVSVGFARQVPKTTPGVFRTRVFTQGTQGKLDLGYKRCRVKQCSRGSHSPTHGRAKEPELCASGIHAPWPWPAPCAWWSTPSPASATGACAPLSPVCSAPPTPPRR
jgi:hypothetical protein